MAAELHIFPQFYSRKLVHVGAGLIIADLGHPINPQLSICVQLIAITSIILSIFYPFTFGKKNDPGIISYNLFVFFWISVGFPIKFILPVFVCDPVGAIVGLNISSPKWHGKKTVAGSIAVLVSCYFCLYFIKSFSWRVIISVLVCLCESYGGKYDNICISLLMLAAYLGSRPLKIPLDHNILSKSLLI